MHARDLVELAALVSAHGPVLIESGVPIPAASIEQYWTASKVRLDRWAGGLKQFAAAAEADTRRRQAQWPMFRGVLEEILSGEMLTRVWTAVLCAYDRRRHSDDSRAGGPQRADRAHGGPASRADVDGSRAGHRRRSGA